MAFVWIGQGLAHVRQIRKAVRRCGAPAEVKKAYGVGLHLHTNIARDVVALMQQILERAKQFPAEAESLVILKQDTDALEKERTAILDTDTKQDTKRANSPLATRERNQTANRIRIRIRIRIRSRSRLRLRLRATLPIACSVESCAAPFFVPPPLARLQSS